MNMDNYDWKDRQRAQRDRAQAFSWLGIVIIILMISALTMMMLYTGDDWVAHNRQQTEEIRQCLNEGRTAINTEHGVSCE